MKHRLLLLPLISALFLTFASCRQKYLRLEGETWGTTYHIVYGGPEISPDSVAARLSAIDEELSLFNPASVVSRVNRCELDSVGPRFIEVLGIAMDVCRLSDGMYDPTVGPLTELWGFGTADTDSMPSDSAITAALATVGLQECTISAAGHIVKKSPATCFDFSSIAKGYGIDCIADMFERNGIYNYMIEIGGEVLAAGVNEKGRPWRIQVDSPQGGFGHVGLAVQPLGPARTALATSGNYRNYRNHGDGAYGHTLSPLSGRPVASEVLSATVEAPSCALADALATACMAVGTQQRAVRLLDEAGVRGMIVVADADGNLRCECCGGFAPEQMQTK